ncbi:MAG: hypothetical protein HZB48_00970 [Actinobacteria bacterium]|nr:hypothetical protein [Actinomycetota bacterium]
MSTPSIQRGGSSSRTCCTSRKPPSSRRTATRTQLPSGRCTCTVRGVPCSITTQGGSRRVHGRWRSASREVLACSGSDASTSMAARMAITVSSVTSV